MTFFVTKVGGGGGLDRTPPPPVISIPAANPNEVEETLLDRNAEEMAKEGFYLVKLVLRHCY